MRTEQKYLGFGLFLGLILTLLLLAGFLLSASISALIPTSTPTQSTNTPQPSATIRPPTKTFTPTPTLIRIKTNTPVPTKPSSTPTLTDTLLGLVESGHLLPIGPLSVKQQFQVYESSIIFVRKTTDESRQLGEDINGKGYGSPTDICGPLSIAILQEAGLINKGIDPYRFWLLNPDLPTDRQTLAKVFPKDSFENIRLKTKLNKIDWLETPLLPGDFIYIYAGSEGNFEHMLVVNRVDKFGRAYSVTNHLSSEGFIITEALLYNPSNPNVGLFPVWTTRPYAHSGATGFAGIEIWRIKSTH